MEREKYFKEVLKAFDAELKGIKTATNPSDISYHERKIRPLFTELHLALPLIEEDIVKASRERRKELTEN
jgi:hypothetical protein